MFQMQLVFILHLIKKQLTYYK